jgi:hypothetical protein
MYTYFKSKKIIESNPQIKRVYIEFTNNQIYKKDMNEWMWGNTQLQYRIKRYGVILDQEALQLLYDKNILLMSVPFIFILLGQYTISFIVPSII